MIKKILLTLACCTLAGTATAHEQPVVESRVLLKSTSSWEGTPNVAYPTGQPELTVLKINIPANTALKWHKHPIPNAAYIASGVLEVQTKTGGKSITLKEGEVLPELVDIMHRGKTGDMPVELIVFYAGTPGTPLTQSPD